MFVNISGISGNVKSQNMATAVEEQSEEVPTEHLPPVENTYTIRPNFQHKFRPIIVKELIHTTLVELLQDKDYVVEEVTDMTKSISDELKVRLKDLGYDRYKFIVQVVLGEQRGEGVKMVCRCFWDSDTDNYAQDIYMNEKLFCVAAVYGVYFY